MVINMEMPFGKHEGEEIEDLPISYAKWCLENLDLDGWLEDELVDLVDNSISNKVYHG